MQQWIRDTFVLGTAFWLLGYLASLLLFVSPLYPVMGWILIAFFTPVTVAVTWYWFRARDLPLAYYAEIGAAWTILAVVFDYLFIVVLFSATYYGADVFIYYAATFLIPVCVGLYVRSRRGPKAASE